MIKKTFETLKKLPAIFLWFAIPFLYTVVTTLLARAGSSPDFTSSESLVELLHGIQAIGPETYISWAITAVYILAWNFVIFPVALYYIYEITDNKLSEGYFTRGLERGWWRYVVTMLMFLAAIVAATIPFGIVFTIILMATQASTGVLVLSGIILLALILVSTTVLFMAVCSVIAEEKYGEGLKHMFPSAFKNFFKILPLAALSAAPTIAIFISSYQGQATYLSNDVYTILIGFYSCVMSAFIYTYCMNIYLDYKKNLAEKMQSIEQEAGQEINPDNV